MGYHIFLNGYEFMNVYCLEGYQFGTQTEIVEDICNDSQIKTTCDIPGSLGVETEIGTYLKNIRDYSEKDPITIEYGKEIKITKCYKGSRYFWGCQLPKTIKSNKGTAKCLEIIEIIEIKGGFKIAGIRSDILNSLEFTCENTSTNPTSNSCKLMDLAESELKENKIELAVAHYEQAKICGAVESKPLSAAIKKVNLDSIYLSSFQKGNLLFEQGKFTEALTYYESIIKSYKTISAEFSNKVDKQMNLCRLESERFSILKTADYYYDQGYYDKALSEYSKALAIKSSKDILTRKNFCEQKIEEQYYKNSEIEIAKAERLITQSEKFTEGFSILMKYKHSGRLNGFHFFLMAQIVDSPSRKTIKEFNFSSRKRCLLTHQFMLNAHALGYKSEGFDIYWNEYLNEKSRTCD